MSEVTGTTQVTAEAAPSPEMTAANEALAAHKSGGNVKSGASTDTNASQVSEAAKEAMRKFKIKHHDGLEEEVDEDTVLKTYKERKGHQREANKLLQEGKAEKKKAEQFIQMMKDKKSLWEAVQKLGHNPRQLAEELLTEEIQREMMDPRERELLENKKKLQEYEEKEKAREEAEKKRILDEATKQYVKKYNDEIIGALKESPIPQNKDSVSRMAKYIAQAAKYKISMTAKEAAKLVEQDLRETQGRVYKDATAEQLVALLGEEGLQKIRAYDVAKIKTPEQMLSTPKEQPRSNGDKKRPLSVSEKRRAWKEFNRF